MHTSSTIDRGAYIYRFRSPSLFGDGLYSRENFMQGARDRRLLLCCINSHEAMPYHVDCVSRSSLLAGSWSCDSRLNPNVSPFKPDECAQMSGERKQTQTLTHSTDVPFDPVCIPRCQRSNVPQILTSAFKSIHGSVKRTSGKTRKKKGLHFHLSLM